MSHIRGGRRLTMSSAVASVYKGMSYWLNWRGVLLGLPSRAPSQ